MLDRKILWIKVWSIAAVQASISLTWVIYNLYFPLLLVELGFDKKLAIALLIVENALESIIEPVFGGLSDRQQRLFGSKIPLISWGMVLASISFIGLPCFAIFKSSGSSFSWLLPILAVVWASFMAIFRAPTLSLLNRCATRDRLPQTVSVLTLVGGIVGAFRFDAYGAILNLGAGFAFALGSFSLLLAAFVLRLLNHEKSIEDITNNQPTNISKLLLGLIFTLGIWISWSLRFIMPAIAGILKLQFGEGNGKLAMTIFLMLLGLAALPAGKIATKFNVSKTMQIGALGTIVALAFLYFFSQLSLPVLGLVICFSLILNGIIPLVLNLTPTAKSGLAIGMYFGGFGAGMSSFDLITYFLQVNTISTNIISAILCLLLSYWWLRILKVNK